jgi:hypothetical protein
MSLNLQNFIFGLLANAYGVTGAPLFSTTRDYAVEE